MLRGRACRDRAHCPSLWDACRDSRERVAYSQAIAAAQYLIYLENQYFASPVIGDALAERLAAPEGPEVIVVSPQRGPNPMRVGSSNLNNRPMGLDTECDIAVDACHVPIHKLESVRRGIREFRDGLIGHYLECTASALARAAQREGCYAGAIRSLCDINRNHLRRVVPRRLGLLRSLIAEFHLGDPEGSGRRHGASVPPRSRW